MDNKKDPGESLQLSRRSFLKVATGALAGAVILGATSIDASAVDFDLAGSEAEAQVQLGMQTFSDSLNRRVMLPRNIERIVPSGRFAQIMLCTLCPEKLAAVSAFDASEHSAYQRGGMGNLSRLAETGEMYSSRGRSINTARIADVEADIVLDLGDPKTDLQLSLDYMQMNTNKPAVFIHATFGELPQAYRQLGALLGCESRAEELATYIERLFSDIELRRTAVETPKTILYAGNDMGLYDNHPLQNAVIEFLGGRAAGSLTSDRIDIGALLDRNIDYIIFIDHDCFDSLISGHGEAYNIWSSVPAIQRGSYAVTPALYHNWFGSPPLFPQTIGLMWLGNLMWPSVYDYDMVAKTKEFYNLFFNYSLSDEDSIKLLGMVHAASEAFNN